MKSIPKKLILSILLAGASAVYAQPSGQGSDHGYAPPSDEQPPPPDDTKPVEAPPEGTKDVEVHEAHGDPTLNFNFAHDFWSYHGKDEYGGKLGDGKMVDANGNVVLDHEGKPAEEEAMSPPFIFMVLNFLILMGLLVWKGGPIVRQIAAERHDQIKTALDEAAKLRKQAADKLAEYESKLKDADAEIKAMVEGMKKDAEADKVRILENAEKQSAQMKKDAEARIAAEIELARAMLTKEVTAAAAVATEKLLREKMVPGDQSKLVTQFINDVQERA